MSIKVAVTASTPGADTNTYSMFDSTVTFAAPNQSNGKSCFANHDIGRLLFTLENSHAGTLKLYRSVNNGTNWDQVGDDIVVAAATATDVTGPYDFLVDPHPDVKLDWVNGNSAQTTWRPNVTLVPKYHGPGE